MKLGWILLTKNTIRLELVALEKEVCGNLGGCKFHRIECWLLAVHAWVGGTGV